MYASPKWYHFCSGVCNVSPTFFPYGLEIMMFWVMQQLVEMEQIQLHLCRCGVGFDATYDALVNTLTSGGVKEL
jgi:hypothetical protein